MGRSGTFSHWARAVSKHTVPRGSEPPSGKTSKDSKFPSSKQCGLNNDSSRIRPNNVMGSRQHF